MTSSHAESKYYRKRSTFFGFGSFWPAYLAVNFSYNIAMINAFSKTALSSQLGVMPRIPGKACFALLLVIDLLILNLIVIDTISIKKLNSVDWKIPIDRLEKYSR